MAKKTRVSKPRALSARLKGQQAIKLRMVGLTIDAIATQLGYASPSSAYKAIMRELEATAKDMSESVEAVRQIELRRLDQMQVPIWTSVLSGDQQSIATALRIAERRASLLGLDAPKQFEARIKVDVLSWNQALRDFLDIYRQFHNNSPQAPKLMERIDRLGEERFAGMLSS